MVGTCFLAARRILDFAISLFVDKRKRWVEIVLPHYMTLAELAITFAPPATENAAAIVVHARMAVREQVHPLCLHSVKGLAQFLSLNDRIGIGYGAETSRLIALRK